VVNPSTTYFPLRSNASALFAGPGVAGVRRRILAAGLLSDQVVLEDGLHLAWAGADGASTLTAHGESVERWQTPTQRGRATGARHYMAVRSSAAPENSPFHTMVSTDATFSWRATFEPFRRELPAGAARWLDFGHVTDDGRAKAMVREWKSEDRLRSFRVKRVRSAGRTGFAYDAILDAGYYDLAVATITGSAVSFDHRHGAAIAARVLASAAQPVGGHYALQLLMPVDFGWADVPGLRNHPALREYRAIVREVEEEALRAGGTISKIDDLIEREYSGRVARASAKGVPFSGRVALTAIGFVVGAAADTIAPVAGGAAVAAGAFATGEVLARSLVPRWLAVDRRLRGRRNGL